MRPTPPTNAAKNVLDNINPHIHSKRRGRRRLRSLAFLPNLVTVGNLLCGFAAIHFAIRSVYESGGGSTSAAPIALPPGLIALTLPSFLSVGAGLVFVGMAFDVLDGLLARVTRGTTDFGGQLDSLADIVTFGVAPASLMMALMFAHFSGDTIPSPVSDRLLGRFAWVSAAVYVAFTALRLARFNVEHAETDKDYRSFQGLPSPGAASVIAALIIFQDQHLGRPFRDLIVYAMPIVALLTAGLMVSRLPYAKYHRAFLLGRKPFGQFIGLVLIIAVFWLYKSPTLLLLVFWYWASGPIRFLIGKLRTKPDVAVQVDRPTKSEIRRSA